jgi:hypothetical protein
MKKNLKNAFMFAALAVVGLGAVAASNPALAVSAEEIVEDATETVQLFLGNRYGKLTGAQDGSGKGLHGKKLGDGTGTCIYETADTTVEVVDPVI